MKKQKIKIHKHQQYASPEMLKSGLFFSEGIKMHFQKYFHLFSLNNFGIAIMASMTISLFIAIRVSVDMLPIYTKKIMVINNIDPDNITKKKNKIKIEQIKSEGSANVNLIYANVKNFISQIESYALNVSNEKEIKEIMNNKISFLKNNATTSILKQYMSRFEKGSSKENLFLKHASGTSIEIEDIRLIYASNQTFFQRYFLPNTYPNKAEVIFGSSGSKGVYRKYKAIMDFSFSVNFTGNPKRKTNKPKMSFTVNYYKVDPI